MSATETRLHERTWRAPAKRRKRCPHCGRMVEVGTPAVFRQFTTYWYGFQRGGYLGERGERRTHAYHEACADQAPELAAREEGR